MSTQHAAVRIDTDGTVTVLADASYESLSDGVGGLIEAAPTDERIVIWVNEGGKVNELEFNPLGHALWVMVDSYGCTAAGDWMAGPCVVTGTYDDEGETTSVPDWVLPLLQRLCDVIHDGDVAASLRERQSAMGEWMSAEVHVRVPDEVDIDPWLCPRHDRYRYRYHVLGVPDDSDDVTPDPISDLLATAVEAGFEWEWEPDRRLLSDGTSDLEVNYGLDEWFSGLANALRNAGWGYHFESVGKYELPGECWEWMPGWSRERALVQSGETKALDAQGLRAALSEATESGVDPAEHLTAVLAPWPGWAPAPDLA